MDDNSKARYSVIFGDSSPAQPSTKTILVRPENDRWNDFSLRTHVTYDISGAGIDYHNVHGLLAFVTPGGRGDLSYLSKLLSTSNRSWINAEDVSVPFFTMLRSMDDYREFVDALGPSEVQEVLLSLNDVIAMIEFGTAPSWLGDALVSDVFTMSFIRSSEAFFVFKNASPLLHGATYETFQHTSTSLVADLPANVRPVDEMVFSFDRDGPLPKRIAVVIGKNGVGKSQTLSSLARTALHEGQTLKDADGERFLFSRLLAFAPTNDAEQVFPEERRSEARVWYRRYSLNRARQSREDPFLTDLLVQLARSGGRIGTQRRWDIFLSAIEAIDGWRDIGVPLRSVPDEYLPLSRLRSDLGEERSLQTFASVDLDRPPRRQIDDDVFELSSGEFSFLIFAAQVCLDVENGSLLLFDEPETHLHPQLISRFVSLLNQLLEATGSVAILATHSVFVVREVFREQVTVMRRTSDGVTLERPRLRTFGADPGAIAYFVFGEDEPSSLATEVQQNLIASGMSWEELYEQYGQELSLEFMSELRETIEFGTSE